MSSTDEKAGRLHRLIVHVADAEKKWEPDAESATRALAAIVTELGLTWEMVDAVQSARNWSAGADIGAASRIAQRKSAVEALATLLTAAGVAR